MLKRLATGVICALGISGAVQAATLDFEIDYGASFVDLTAQSGGGHTCKYTHCAVTATLSDELDGLAFSLGKWERKTFKLFTLTASGSTGWRWWEDRDFEISAQLAFKTPDAVVSADGDGGLLFKHGWIRGGNLDWDRGDRYHYFSMPDGSRFAVWIDEGHISVPKWSHGIHEVSIYATVLAKHVPHPITPPDNVTPVPLPASGLLLLVGVGGLAVMRRRIPTDQ